MDTSQKTRKIRSPIEQSNDLENASKKGRRCPKGTRRNRKTGECEPVIPPSGAADPIAVPVQTVEEIVVAPTQTTEEIVVLEKEKEKEKTDTSILDLSLIHI